MVAVDPRTRRGAKSRSPCIETAAAREDDNVQFQVSQKLRDDFDAHRLVFSCEDCAHFVAADVDGGGEGACDLLYPIAPHRRRAFTEAADGDPIWFCKMFEAS